MESKTFIYQNQIALTVPPGAIKALSVQPHAAFVTVDVRGTGLLKLGLDMAQLLGPGQHELIDASNSLTNAVFRFDDPVSVVSLTRLAPGGDDDGGAPSPSPAGPTIK